MKFIEQGKSIRAGPGFIRCQRDKKKKVGQDKLSLTGSLVQFKSLNFEGFEVVVWLLACSEWLLGHWVF